MTPKEKAHDLFEKMAHHLCNTDAQECAIIAVDEMLENDGWSSSQLEWDIFKKYYLEVKKELEQILEDGFSRGV